MKIIVIGLGNFGASLGIALMERNNEVIGVDIRMNKVELYKDKLTYTICMDTTDELAIYSLPIKDADIVIVSIGEDVGASITTTALVKKNAHNTQIISRAISSIHSTILETMGIEKIIHPEATFAKELADKLHLKGTMQFMHLDNQFEIVEIQVPPAIVGQTIKEVDVRQKYNLNVVTLLREVSITNLIGNKSKTNKVVGVVSADTVFLDNDVIVLFGKNKDIEKFIKEKS